MIRLAAIRSVAFCLLCTALSGCDYDLDLFGPEASGWSGSDAAPPPDPELMVRGEVFVDGYPVAWDEAFVEVYAPEDTLRPVPVTFIAQDDGPWITLTRTRAPVAWGAYELNFGSFSDPAVCSYLIRVILWNGSRSELRPLVPNPPAGCDPQWVPLQGSRFEMAGYGEEEERWVGGTVFVDGVLAGQGGAGVELQVRRRRGEPPAFVTTGPDGSFRVTLDGPQWFALCSRGIGARFRAGDYEQFLDFGGFDEVESCGSGRRLPEIRLGQTLAAEGVVRVDGAPAGEGGGWVRLLDPADSTLVGDTARTQDNGGYRLYFPLGLEEPGCDWLIEAGITDGPSEVRPYQRFDHCSDREWHEFELTAG